MTNEPDATAASAAASTPGPATTATPVKLGDVLGLARRIARFEQGIFDEICDDERLTTPSLVLPAVLFVLAGVGSLLYLALVYADLPLNADSFVIRHLLLGTVTGYAMWAVWVLLVEGLLSWRYRVRVDRERLIRGMGFATLPIAIMLPAFIPDLITDYGNTTRDIMSIGFGLGLVALFAWYRLSELAVSAAAPDATARQVLVVNLVAFVIVATVLTWLASSAGVAPGVWMHSNAFDFYIG